VEQQVGLNTYLPTPEEGGIIADKREAYVTFFATFVP
jgi:hypothetical protein